ncbi:hypothetical protein Tco_1092601 [Tanacetum coccineum]|uniref:Uncharacterized protein n=1 Tax=Tanacetum coccineum TaxID=301880 RepID=A0ABQ5IAA9_9ASTR
MISWLVPQDRGNWKKGFGVGLWVVMDWGGGIVWMDGRAGLCGIGWFLDTFFGFGVFFVAFDDWWMLVGCFLVWIDGGFGWIGLVGLDLGGLGWWWFMFGIGWMDWDLVDLWIMDGLLMWGDKELIQLA